MLLNEKRQCRACMQKTHVWNGTGRSSFLTVHSKRICTWNKRQCNGSIQTTHVLNRTGRPSFLNDSFGWKTILGFHSKQVCFEWSTHLFFHSTQFIEWKNINMQLPISIQNTPLFWKRANNSELRWSQWPPDPIWMVKASLFFLRSTASTMGWNNFRVKE